MVGLLNKAAGVIYTRPPRSGMSSIGVLAIDNIGETLKNDDKVLGVQIAALDKAIESKEAELESLMSEKDTYMKKRELVSKLITGDLLN